MKSVGQFIQSVSKHISTIETFFLFQDNIAILENQLEKSESEVELDINESPLYFTRTRGLFRECYPGEKSEDPEKTSSPLGERVVLYMSPVETWCRNLDYYIPDEKDVTKTLGKEEMTRIRK